MLNGLDSDQERHFVSPDLGPNWLQLISTYQQTTKVRPNKKISVFRVTGLKILGRVGTHIFFIIFFSGNKNNFMHLERHFIFQNASNYIFSRKT